jgi:hypothetical protein
MNYVQCVHDESDDGSIINLSYFFTVTAVRIAAKFCYCCVQVTNEFIFDVRHGDVG